MPFTLPGGIGYAKLYMNTPSAGAARSFSLNEFEGPLDLLLFLIKKNEVNIYDIPIAQITEQYMGYLCYAEELDLEEATEFYALAATLLYIKSRMLLPAELGLEDEDEDPREELVEKLIEYQKIKKLSELMEEKEREAEWVIERKKLQRTLPFMEEELWEKVEVWDLLKTFSRLVMTKLPGERIIDLYEEVSVNEKLTLLMEFLDEKGECGFNDLVVRKGSIMDIVCAFLAILEAVKLRMALIFQHRMFGDILIRRRPQEAAPARGASPPKETEPPTPDPEETQEGQVREREEAARGEL
jgi:segregation and condensation protein A